MGVGRHIIHTPASPTLDTEEGDRDGGSAVEQNHVVTPYWVRSWLFVRGGASGSRITKPATAVPLVSLFVWPLHPEIVESFELSQFG